MTDRQIDEVWDEYASDKLTDQQRLDWLWYNFGDIIDDTARDWDDNSIEQSIKKLKEMQEVKHEESK
jgi:hypothetical protein